MPGQIKVSRRRTQHRDVAALANPESGSVTDPCIGHPVPVEEQWRITLIECPRCALQAMATEFIRRSGGAWSFVEAVCRNCSLELDADDVVHPEVPSAQGVSRAGSDGGSHSTEG